MTREDFIRMLQRLCDGVVDRACLDDPELSLKQMFVELALGFNNEDLVVQLPDNAYDLQYVHLLDANDCSRIAIQRDREYLTIFIQREYYAVTNNTFCLFLSF